MSNSRTVDKTTVIDNIKLVFNPTTKGSVMKMVKLFSSSLGLGSRGPAVVALQLWLLGKNGNHQLIPDGYYGEQTAIEVRKIQNLFGVEPDGCFNSKTREAIRMVMGVNFDSLPVDIFQGETFFA